MKGMTRKNLRNVHSGRGVLLMMKVCSMSSSGRTGEMKKEIPVVETGIFGEHMEVSLTNDGPFTIVLDSSELNI